MPLYSCNLWQYTKKCINSKSQISIQFRIGFLKNILDGLIFLQDHDYCHLDIKPSNILIKTTDEGIWNKVDCVITDFGLTGRSDKENGLDAVFDRTDPLLYHKFGYHKYGIFFGQANLYPLCSP